MLKHTITYTATSRMVDATGFLGTAYRDASIILQAIIEIPNSVFQSHTGPIRICSLIIQSAYDSHGNDLLKKYGKYLQSTTLVEDELIWVTDSKVDLSIKTNSIIATIKGSFDDEWEFFTDDCTLIVLNTFTALLIDDIKFEFSAIATSYVNNDPLISIQAAAPDPTHPEKHGNGFLWKPISESSGGKLVAILPPEFTPYAEYAHLRASLTGPVLETPWQTGIYNGDRKHSWFSKTGSGYPSGTWVVTQCQGRTWGWKITGNMGARHENEIPTVAGSDNNNGVYPQPPADEPVRGIMATDYVTMKDLSTKLADMAVLRSKYFNTIYSVIDMPYMVNGTGAGKVRPHIGAGRTATGVSDLCIKNIDLMYTQGFRVMLVCGNEPSVRMGLSMYMPGLNHMNLSTNDLYTAQRLANEKACIADLLAKRGDKIYGITLYLEPMNSLSIPFVKELGRYVRQDLKWTGKVYSCGIANARWDGDVSMDIRSAPSQYNLDTWMQENRAHLRNGDGLMMTEAQGPTWIPQMTKNLGPDGGILWFDMYRGDVNGPHQLMPWMVNNVAWTGSTPQPEPQPIPDKVLSYTATATCVDAAGLYKAYAKGVAASGTMKLAMSKATYDAGTGAVDVSITLTDIKPNANSPSYIKNLISSLAKDAVGKEFTEKAVSMKDRKITWTKETKDIKLVVNADITTGYASMVITATLDVKSAWIKMLLSRATFKGSAVLV